MADTYLILVIVLFALAIFDLVVGVSNDAVNFLTSAIGSKVARRRTVMLIAAIGIFLGAALSSGMMEVARKGVFHPGAFSFEELMVVFLAVMITDIILLDLFNTFGMPTSTTVSIVFELLGASVTVALIKMTAADQGLDHLSTYINGPNALKIVTGILLSVIFAFTLGAILMYVSRLLFSFRYKHKMKFLAPIWSALALTAMTYFLLVKGMKNATFIDKDFMAMVKDNLWVSLGVIFGFWAVVLTLVANLTKLNILKFAVLFGTFALAMAFAGNDLVNFIGVPIAGFQSYKFWAEAGSPEGLPMTFLEEAVPTEPFLLFIAGGIMVATLLLSKKARSVTDTTVKLGRQDEGAERFQANAFSRGVVVVAQTINKVFIAVLPAGVSRRITKAFEPAPEEATEDGEEGPAFDLIRASVNLAVASMIISYASSQKLPLSTTYVSFMVAMGASLADRAWGRDSAVYRIAGVINVVLGWFGTAFIAFTVSAIFALIISSFQVYGVGALVLLAIGLVVRSSIVHRRNEAKIATAREAEIARTQLSTAEVRKQVKEKAQKTILSVRRTIGNSIDGLLSENKNALFAARKEMALLYEANEAFRFSLYHYLKRIDEEDTDTSRLYLNAFDLEQDIIQSTKFINDTCVQHVQNIHSPLLPEQARHFQHIRINLDKYLSDIADTLGNGGVDNKHLQDVVTAKETILSDLELVLGKQSQGIRDKEYNSRNSLLNFSLAFEIKDLTSASAQFVQLFHLQNL